MDWMPLVSTASGAVIALAGTMLADTLRRRDERGRGLRTDRRQSYLDYVLALDTAHGLLRTVAAGTGEQAEIREAALAAIGQLAMATPRPPGTCRAGTP